MADFALLDKIDANFIYYAPRSDAEKKFYEDYRTKVKEVAKFLALQAYESDELKTAIMRFESAVFWGNAAVARHGLDTEDD